MTSRRAQLASSTVIVLISAITLVAAQEFPRDARELRQIAGAFPQSELGPLERRAKPITPENPIPRRTRLVRPPYPPEAATVGAHARFTLRVTIDHLGTVGEVRTVGAPILGAMAPPGPTEARAFTEGLLALVRSAKDAVSQWLYEPPADAPIAFDVVIAFTPEGDGEVISQGAARLSSPDADSPQATPATKVKHVIPVYPPAAREAKISGIVILEVEIGVEGFVQEARVVRSIPELDDAALEAVKQWEYTPRRVDGEPMPVKMTVTIQFSLQ
jgi:protein TonB